MGNRKFRNNPGENLDYPRENWNNSSRNGEFRNNSGKKKIKNGEGKVGGDKDTPKLHTELLICL